MSELPNNLGSISADQGTRPIFLAVSQALKQEYPESERLAVGLKPSVVFTNYTNIITTRTEDVVAYTSSVTEEVASILHSFGMPIKEAVSWRSQSLPKNSYADYLKPKFYLLTNTRLHLMNGGVQAKQQAAIEIGRILIEGSIKAMAYATSPYEFEQKQSWDFLWGYMVKTEAYGFFQNLESYLKSKKERHSFREARDEVLEHFTLNGIAQLGPVFKAVGAKVLFILPGQALTFPERVVGADFDNAVVRLLAVPVMRRYVNLVSKYSQGKIQIDEDAIAQDQKRTKEEENEEENAKLVHDVLGLGGKKLFSAYIRSELPLRYIRTNNPLVNPFRYATFFNE